MMLPDIPPQNDGSGCVIIDEPQGHLPDHINPCRCEEHDGVCEACGYIVTVGPSGTEYGHARSHNRSPGSNRQDCPHRPPEVDPKRSWAIGGGKA